jgi:predicted lipoprotein with Yx(FWY)xxD motif
VKLLAVPAAVLVAAVSVALAPAAAKSKPTLTVGTSRYGRVLFDGNGRALYAFTRDRRGGRSRCYGDCARAWPVYYARAGLRVGKGVRQSLTGTVRRRDGRLQMTYDGRPLYYYVHDVGPRQISCQNVAEFGGTWLVIRANGRLVR